MSYMHFMTDFRYKSRNSDTLSRFSTRNQSRKSDIFKVPIFSMTLGPDFFRRQKTIFCNNFVRFSFLSIQTEATCSE